MRNDKAWNIIGWISFGLFVLTGLIYFFVDENYTESPSWLIAAVASWFFQDHVSKTSKS